MSFRTLFGDGVSRPAIQTSGGGSAAASSVVGALSSTLALTSQMQDRVQEQEARRDDFWVRREFQRAERDTLLSLEELRQSIPPGGGGYRAKAKEIYRARMLQALNEAPTDRARDLYQQSAELAAPDFEEAAYEYELAEARNFYATSIEEQTDDAMQRIARSVVAPVAAPVASFADIHQDDRLVLASSSVPAPPSLQPVPDEITIDPVQEQIAQIESGGDIAARNPNSTASGKYQFIKSTALELLRQNEPDVFEDRSDDEVFEAFLEDEAQQDRMEAIFRADNIEHLVENGVEITGASQYLAHFAGRYGAVKIMQAEPETPISEIMSAKAIEANANIQWGDKRFQEFTAQDLRDFAGSKMGDWSSTRRDIYGVPVWNGPIPKPTQSPEYQMGLSELNELIEAMPGTQREKAALKKTGRSQLVAAWLTGQAQSNPAVAMAALRTGDYDADLTIAQQGQIEGVAGSTQTNMETLIGNMQARMDQEKSIAQSERYNDLRLSISEVTERDIIGTAERGEINNTQATQLRLAARELQQQAQNDIAAQRKRQQEVNYQLGLYRLKTDPKFNAGDVDELGVTPTNRLKLLGDLADREGATVTALRKTAKEQEAADKKSQQALNASDMLSAALSGNYDDKIGRELQAKGLLSAEARNAAMRTQDTFEDDSDDAYYSRNAAAFEIKAVAGEVGPSEVLDAIDQGLLNSEVGAPIYKAAVKRETDKLKAAEASAKEITEAELKAARGINGATVRQAGREGNEEYLKKVKGKEGLTKGQEMVESGELSPDDWEAYVKGIYEYKVAQGDEVREEQWMQFELGVIGGSITASNLDEADIDPRDRAKAVGFVRKENDRRQAEARRVQKLADEQDEERLKAIREKKNVGLISLASRGQLETPENYYAALEAGQLDGSVLRSAIQINNRALDAENKQITDDKTAVYEAQILNGEKSLQQISDEGGVLYDISKVGDFYALKQGMIDDDRSKIEKLDEAEQKRLRDINAGEQYSLALNGQADKDALANMLVTGAITREAHDKVLSAQVSFEKTHTAKEQERIGAQNHLSTSAAIGMAPDMSVKGVRDLLDAQFEQGLSATNNLGQTAQHFAMKYNVVPDAALSFIEGAMNGDNAQAQEEAIAAVGLVLSANPNLHRQFKSGGLEAAAVAAGMASRGVPANIAVERALQPMQPTDPEREALGKRFDKNEGKADSGGNDYFGRLVERLDPKDGVASWFSDADLPERTRLAYRNLLRDAYVNNGGNYEAAEAEAEHQFLRTHGVSSARSNGPIWMRYPPEQMFGMSSDQVDAQVKTYLAERGVLGVDQYELQAPRDGAGEMSYRVLFVPSGGGAVQVLRDRFVPDPEYAAIQREAEVQATVDQEKVYRERLDGRMKRGGRTGR